MSVSGVLYSNNRESNAAARKTVGKIDAEEIAQRARTLIAARLLVAPSHEVEYQSAKEKSK